MASLKDQVDDLQSTVGEARQILEDAYTPEATRADLVTAVSEAIAALSDEDEGDEDDDQDDDTD
jgi:20S proteasome alpha/beta subunit